MATRAQNAAKAGTQSDTTSGPKTRPTEASVPDFIATVADERRRADCLTLCHLMQAATGAAPVLWGSAIVGFGATSMRYANGACLDWPVIAFSPRKNDLTLYLMAGLQTHTALLQRLGNHKTGQVCLYVKRLSDVDMTALTELITDSVAAARNMIE